MASSGGNGDPRARPKVLLLGHSFVWRFGSFCASNNCPPNLGLHQIEFSWAGKGGRTVPTLLAHDFHMVASRKPSIVIIEIGSNDLCNPFLSPATVGSAIDDMCGLLLSSFDVEHVIVSQILPRVKLPFQDYNNRVHALNQYLRVVLGEHECVTFWRHHGFTYPAVPVFLDDGIHPNDHGMLKLWRSYRGAVRSVLSLR
jgi:hypothetical protein